MEDVNYTKTPLVRSKSSAVTAPADLPAVIEAFNKCRRSDGTLATDHYLAAVNELVRLALIISSKSHMQLKKFKIFLRRIQAM